MRESIHIGAKSLEFVRGTLSTRLVERSVIQMGVVRHR
jgi:hypothetical protein